MLWGAFNNASSAMQVFTTDLGSISQNIANVNTTGYKRQEMMFSTVMSEQHAAPATSTTGLNIFGVQATQRNLIQAQGVIQASTTSTDLAINGNGFFMVAPPVQGMLTAAVAGSGAGVTNVPTNVSTTDSNSVMYTRAGNWHRAYGADTDPTLARSYFLNDAGSYLLGWMADSSGAIPANAKLEPVYTMAPKPIANNGTSAVNNAALGNPTQITLPGRATTSGSIQGNLPSQSPMTAKTFTSTQSVTDPNTNTAYDMTLNWNRVDGNTWTVTPSLPAAAGTIGTGPITVDADPFGVLSQPAPGLDAVGINWASGLPTDPPTTVNLLGASTYTSTASVMDPNGVNQTVTLDWARTAGNTWTVTPSMAAGVGTIPAQTQTVTLDSNDNIVSPSSRSLDLSITWDPTTYGATAGTTSKTLSLNGSQPKVNLGGPIETVQKIPVEVFDDQFNSHVVNLAFERAGTNSWYMHVMGGDGSGPPPEPVLLEYADPTTTGSSGQLLKVNGAAATTVPLNFNWTVTDPTTGVATPTTATVNMDLAKLSQYDSSSLYTGTVSQDGYARGLLAGTAFNEKGEMVGYYDNGHSRVLFQVPVANFVAENSLDPVSGTMFRRTAAAGAMTVSSIDQVPGENSSFVTSSLEGSTTSIEDEFTRMIMTQKAYSTNAQVFKTADEMTTTARDLKT
ncbi:MAG TPA: flagellar hook-basal body complex protein [Magnetospirillum sp.]|jgi:flagellar hook protein FlgE|nr:flagellar hook-basal body complex protein [Magnetospirillum sp.]